jgi:ubiquinone biosynthesis protein UbiJ
MAAAPSSLNPGSAFDALKPLAGRALETALNRILALDPDTQSALQALDGRRVQLALDAPPLALQLTVSGGRFVVGPVPRDVADEPDLAVHSTLVGLLSQLPFLKSEAAQASTAKVGKLRIAGDAELARQLQKLADGFDPDWAKPFADVFGDVIGVQIANALRGALRFGRDSADTFARNSAEFLTEESRDVPARAELDAFHDDVDALRDRVERLAAKVAGFDRAISDRAMTDPSQKHSSKKVAE